MSTRAIYRDDAYQRQCEAVVTHISEHGVELDQTVFYPLGGGQAGDRGSLRLPDGARVEIADTRKSKREGATPDDSLHVIASGLPPELVVGTRVSAVIDWSYRHQLMRFHTATHLLCALLPYPVNGCSITADYARLDFATNEPIDKATLQQGLDALCAKALTVSTEWISDEQMLANPDLVRTMSVKPPMGFGRVRLLRIADTDADIDLQPCGGTHVNNTSEIAPVLVAKIEKKSANSRRVTLRFSS
ncbi:MAG: alanyl-tRNA editing protein [Burkholderiaceae bacterium]